MGKLTAEEQAQLDALTAKQSEPDQPEPDDDDDDGGHVVVLRGSRADSFLAGLLGTGKSSKGKGKSTPAADQPEPESDQDQDQGDQDQDQQPPAGHRYFRR